MAPASSIVGWFDTDNAGSKVCTDLAMTSQCTDNAFIKGNTGSSTELEGMSLVKYGYQASGQFHMRQNSDSGGSSYGGLCSSTQNDNNNAVCLVYYNTKRVLLISYDFFLQWKDSFSSHCKFLAFMSFKFFYCQLSIFTYMLFSLLTAVGGNGLLIWLK